ncbi:MAG: PQQ-binding-like beta-propeller repeat protein [Acidobacteriota bacterium]
MHGFRLTCLRIGYGLLVAALLFTALPLIASSHAAQDWPQFRGPARDGHAPAATELLIPWPETGPAERWRRPIGNAFSSIAAVGNALYTGDSDESGDYALRIDAETGKTVWRTRLGDLFENSFGNGPRATPTVDGDTVYITSGGGVLAALAAADGTVRWSIDLKETYQAEMPHFGYASSPLVDGDRLLVETGGETDTSAALTALNKKTGELIWRSAAAQPAYSAPIRLDLHGQAQYVLVTKDGVRGLDIADGGLLWQVEWAPEGGIKPPPPLVVGENRLFVSASYDIGAMLIEVTGPKSAKALWDSKVMRNHFNASVYHDGVIYGFDNATLKALAPDGGETHWAKRGRLGKGSLVYADEHLVVLTETGTLLLLEATASGYVEKGSSKAMSGRCWTAPTIADGKLYLRNREEMVSYDLQRAAPTTSAETTAALTAYADAIGGDVRQGIRALKITGTQNFNGIDTPLTIYHRRPNHMRIEIGLERGSGTIAQVTDGEAAWSQLIGSDDPRMMRRANRVLDDDAAARMIEEMAAFDDALLQAAQEAGPTAERVGSETLDGREMHHLAVTLPSGRVQHWFLDAETHRPVRRTTEQANRRGTYTGTWFYDDFRAIAPGVVVPFYVEREDSQHVRAHIIDRIEVNPSLDDALLS